MEAINLIHRYNSGKIDTDQTGIFTCIDEEDVKNTAHFSEWMFGAKTVLKGGLQLGATYIYAYNREFGVPDGFEENDKPAMILLLPDGDYVFIYEIEGL
jgi:hypothetical protein